MCEAQHVHTPSEYLSKTQETFENIRTYKPHICCKNLSVLWK